MSQLGGCSESLLVFRPGVQEEGCGGAGERGETRGLWDWRALALAKLETSGTVPQGTGQVRARTNTPTLTPHKDIKLAATYGDRKVKWGCASGWTMKLQSPGRLRVTHAWCPPTQGCMWGFPLESCAPSPARHLGGSVALGSDWSAGSFEAGGCTGDT